ncbi:putative tail compoletion protein [Vibrio phage pVco-14]|nr:putative tail compoletion protein [Vibrio phage pVco-14]
MSYYEIERALDKAARAAIGQFPISCQSNVITDTAAIDHFWFKLTNLRAESNVATLGSKGEDNHPGVYQIDVNLCKHHGEGPLLQKVDELVKLFPAGSSFTSNGQAVKLTRTSVSPTREVNGFLRVSLSLFYYSRSTRR